MVDTYQTGKGIVKFFRNHQHFLALFRGKSELDLLKVSKTRFASHYILLKRLMDVREALCTTVVTSKWKDLVKACDQQTRSTANVIAQNIMDDRFWEEINIILDITKPLYMVIKFSDGEGPKSGDIYEKMDNMLGEIKDVMRKDGNPHKDDWPEVETIILDRWGKMNWSFHCLAFALSPKYYDQEYLATPAPGGGKNRERGNETPSNIALTQGERRLSEQPYGMLLSWCVVVPTRADCDRSIPREEQDPLLDTASNPGAQDCRHGLFNCLFIWRRREERKRGRR
jgi:hypothetical protein